MVKEMLHRRSQEGPWAWAALLQAPALIAERWVFFAQAKHPQNLYYQTVG